MTAFTDIVGQIEEVVAERDHMREENEKLRELLHRWITCYPDRSFGLADESAIAIGMEWVERALCSCYIEKERQ